MDLAKAALDAKSALAAAAKHKDSLQALEAAVRSFHLPDLAMWAEVPEAVAVIQTLSSEMPSDLSEQHSGLLVSLTEAKDALVQACPCLESTLPLLCNFLNKQWPSGCGSLALQFDSDADPESVAKSVLHANAVAGGGWAKGVVTCLISFLFQHATLRHES